MRPRARFVLKVSMFNTYRPRKTGPTENPPQPPPTHR